MNRTLSTMLGASLLAAALGQAAVAAPSPAPMTPGSAAPAAPGAPAGAPAPAAVDAAAAQCFEAPVPVPAGAPAAWNAFVSAAAAVNDYTVSIHEVDETDPPKVASEDRVLHFSYAKPCYGRVSVISGRLAGSEAVWHGGHKLRGHLGGEISHLKAIIPDTDPKTTDVRGLPMYAAYFPWIINRFNETGAVAGAPGPTVNGVATDAITVTSKDPKTNYGLTKDTLILSSTTHLPVQNIGYVGDKVVLHADFSEMVLNPGLPVSTFQL